MEIIIMIKTDIYMHMNIGDRHVGKSSLAEQFVSGRFIENYDPTIENTLRKSIGFRGILCLDVFTRIYTHKHKYVNMYVYTYIYIYV
jgi:hypothetical protein